jgi:anti-sigma-K factor RskA
MTESTHPEPIQNLLAGHVLGDLTPDEAEQLQQLLAAQPDLAVEIHQLQEVLAAMPYGLPEAVPSDRVRSQMLQTFQEEITQQTMPPRSPAVISEVAHRFAPYPRTSISFRRSKLAILAGSVAAVLVLAVGINNYQLRQELATTQAHIAYQKDLIAMLQQPQTRLVSLKGMDNMSQSSGNAVITPGQAGTVLVLQDLPAPPPGKSYQLWAIADGKKIACGNFTSNSQGRVVIKLPIASTTANQLTGLAITVEASPTPLAPTGPMVMTSSS